MLMIAPARRAPRARRSDVDRFERSALVPLLQACLAKARAFDNLARLRAACPRLRVRHSELFPAAWTRGPLVAGGFADARLEWKAPRNRRCLLQILRRSTPRLSRYA